MEQRQREEAEIELQNAQTTGEGDQSESVQNDTFKREGKKVGRNEPCPCGSGKKYKHCHGKLS